MFYGGIYIRRKSAYLIVGEETNYGTARSDFSVPLFNPESIGRETIRLSGNAEKDFDLIGEQFARIRAPIARIAAASYGPFESLTRTDKTIKSGAYGRIDKQYGAGPYRGVKLYTLLRRALKKHGLGRDLPVDIHTDATACAVGEAYLRETPANYLLVQLLVTEGIGGSVVSGRNILPSAHHPEMGMLHVRLLDDDPLAIDEGRRDYGLALQEVANTEAFMKRSQQKFRERDFQKLIKMSDRFLWGAPGYYMAQACLAITGIIAPHKIVISGEFDQSEELIINTRSNFASIIRERDWRFSYNAISDPEFISGPVTSEVTAGTTGLMYLASRSRYVSNYDNVVKLRGHGHETST